MTIDFQLRALAVGFHSSCFFEFDIESAGNVVGLLSLFKPSVAEGGPKITGGSIDLVRNDRLEGEGTVWLQPTIDPTPIDSNKTVETGRQNTIVLRDNTNNTVVLHDNWNRKTQKTTVVDKQCWRPCPPRFWARR